MSLWSNLENNKTVIYSMSLSKTMINVMGYTIKTVPDIFKSNPALKEKNHCKLLQPDPSMGSPRII